MKRTAATRLENWFSSPNRKPILLRGARQVGKSTLVQSFAREHGLVLNEMNLERHRDLAPVFSTLDPKAICTRISAILGRDIRAGGTLLFLDEIQAVPEAIAALRYFREEMPELPVAAAGSLLEFALAKHSFSMPVGRIEYLHLGPADFSEFAAAVNPWLASKLDMGTIRSEEGRAIHPEMMRLLRLYMLVGGMPESVQRYADTRSVAEASAVHEQILGTYVVSVGRDIVPIEVKSGKTGTLRALRLMMEEKGLRRAIRFDAGVASVQDVPLDDGREFRLETLPLYAVACPGFSMSSDDVEIAAGAVRGRHGTIKPMQGTPQTEG